MKIVMTLLVRDEQDIIRENIEFHLSQGVDYFITTDNKSVDLTPDFLKKYEQKGVLRYIFERSDNYNQHEWVTKMARIAYLEYGADWVINNDADEFWWPKNGNLKDVFRKLSPEHNIVVANRHNFVATDNADCPFYQSMIYRENISLNPLGKPLPSKVAHRGCKTVVVEQGNHSVTGIEDPKPIYNMIEILHFPIRSYKQFENKIAKGGAAYEGNNELPRATGATWRMLYREYAEKGNLDEYIKKHTYDKNRIVKEIKSGGLIKDTRLKDFLTIYNRRQGKPS